MSRFEMLSLNWLKRAFRKNLCIELVDKWFRQRDVLATARFWWRNRDWWSRCCMSKSSALLMQLRAALMCWWSVEVIWLMRTQRLARLCTRWRQCCLRSTPSDSRRIWESTLRDKHSAWVSSTSGNCCQVILLISRLSSIYSNPPLLRILRENSWLRQGKIF